MIRTIGVVGAFGIVTLLFGIGIVALENIQIAAGIALSIAGLGMIVQGVVTGMLRKWGMA